LERVQSWNVGKVKKAERQSARKLVTALDSREEAWTTLNSGAQRERADASSAWLASRHAVDRSRVTGGILGSVEFKEACSETAPVMRMDLRI
jgi:hypothetical protein